MKSIKWRLMFMYNILNIHLDSSFVQDSNNNDDY